MKTLKKLLLIGSLAIGCMATAQAALVTDWTYTISGIWTAYAPDPGVTLSGDTLSWGVSTGSGQSSLAITNPASNLPLQTYVGGGVPPPAYIGTGVALTHVNNPIYAPSLTSATLTVSLSLRPVLPTPGAEFPLSTIDYDIAFVETPNSYPCAVSGSPTACNDIFVLLGGLLNESFDYDGQTYLVNSFPVGGDVLGLLEDSACDAAGQPHNCIGFTTPENQTTTLAFGLTISTEPLSVPEPGSMALAGLALLGLAVAQQRRLRWTR